MTRYSVHANTHSVTVHRDGCSHQSSRLEGCGCGSTSSQGNQYWFCEPHVSHQAISAWLKRTEWEVFLCLDCFAAGSPQAAP